jgi:hypothetical protein
LTGFTNSGNASRDGPRRTPPARDDHELRHADAVVAENLLRDRFVLAEREPGRPAPGERAPAQLEERHDVLIEGTVVAELVREIEHEVGLIAVELLAQEIEVVEDREVVGLVAELLQGTEHVLLDLPVGGLQLGPEILVERSGRPDVEQREDRSFFFFTATSCA